MNLDNDFINLLKDFLNRNEQSKVKTASLLIRFKINIRFQNKRIRTIENKSKLTKLDLDKLQTISKELVSFISTWCIYINQRIININDIKRSLSGFLTQEQKLLAPLLEKYIKDKASEYHYDALECKKLFEDCSMKGDK